MKKISRKLKNFYLTLGVILLVLGVASVYAIFSQVISDIFSSLNINNVYLQNGILIGFVILFFVFGGTSLRKAFKKIKKNL